MLCVGGRVASLHEGADNLKKKNNIMQLQDFTSAGNNQSYRIMATDRNRGTVSIKRRHLTTTVLSLYWKSPYLERASLY